MKKTKKLKNFDKEEQVRRKEEKGITLIALVITIIILLILAAVSIATLTGENGILTKVNKAKEETETASEEEQRELAQINATMNTEKYYYTTEDKQKVPIPAGFAPTQIEGENTVKNGLVVVDSKGNEFVWIPVTSKEEYERNKNYEEIHVSAQAKDDENYLPDGIYASGEEGNKEKDIVTTAGGFYISRYEAGKEGESTLVSKSGATVWNNIRQYDKDAEQGCKTVAKTFINNSDVKSGLITGIQWDIVMAFVNNKKDGNGVDDYKVATYSTTRHLNSLKQSGQNPADKVCNIYDLEGNYKEYVAEKSDFGHR